MQHTPPRILVIEDEADLAGIVVDYLRAEGWHAETSADGQHALTRFASGNFDVLVLDLMLPGLDGISLCRTVRASSDVAILMTTARVAEIDRLLGLEVGADDYLCKPYSPRELVARIKVQLRHRSRSARSTSAAPGEVAAPDLVIDDATRRARFCGQLLDLTATEHDLLTILARRPGHIYSRAQLLDHLRRDDLDVTDRAIDSHVKNLRKKLSAIAPARELIQSVYGVGYRLEH